MSNRGETIIYSLKPPDGSSVTSIAWGFSEAKIGQQHTLLHRVQGSTADPANCTPGTNQPITKYEPPPSVLPYKGDEVELIERYDKHTFSDAKSLNTEDGFTYVFKDGSVKSYIGDRQPNEISLGRVHTTITPGANTPLDRLGVIQVDLPAVDLSSERHSAPRNSKPGTGGTFLHKITYNDGSAIIASQNGDQGFWDVYGPNNQLKSTIMADPATKTTAIENKQDNSVTFHPQGANSCSVP